MSRCRLHALGTYLFTAKYLSRLSPTQLSHLIRVNLLLQRGTQPTLKTLRTSASTSSPQTNALRPSKAASRTSTMTSRGPSRKRRPRAWGSLRSGSGCPWRLIASFPAYRWATKPLTRWWEILKLLECYRQLSTKYQIERSVVRV